MCGGHREPREGPGSGRGTNDSGKNGELDAALFIKFSRGNSAQKVLSPVPSLMPCPDPLPGYVPPF